MADEKLLNEETEEEAETEVNEETEEEAETEVNEETEEEAETKTNEESVEEDNGFDIDFEAQLVAETESFLNKEEIAKANSSNTSTVSLSFSLLES